MCGVVGAAGKESARGRASPLPATRAEKLRDCGTLMFSTPTSAGLHNHASSAACPGAITPSWRPVRLLGGAPQEADIMLSLRHPNCVALLGLCTSPPCLVTEYMDRGSLTDCLRAAREDPAVAAALTWQRRLGMVGAAGSAVCTRTDPACTCLLPAAPLLGLAEFPRWPARLVTRCLPMPRRRLPPGNGRCPRHGLPAFPLAARYPP